MDSKIRNLLFYEDEGWNLYSIIRVSFISIVTLGVIGWGFFFVLYFLLITIQGSLLGNLHAAPIFGYPLLYLLGLIAYWTPNFQNKLPDSDLKRKLGLFALILVPLIGTSILTYLIAKKYDKRLLTQPYQALLPHLKASPDMMLKIIKYLITAPASVLKKHLKSMKKPEYRSKFRKHTFYLFLAIIGISFIWSISTNTEPVSTNNAPTNTQNIQNPDKQNSPDHNYIDESLSTIKFQLLSSESPHTDLQKKELWRSDYKDRWVKGTLYAHSVDKNTLGEYIILAGVEPEGQYDIGFSPFRIIFKSSEEDKLLQISPNEEFSFKGKLTGYGGISSDITIRKGEIINKSEAEGLSVDEKNEVYDSASSSGDYTECDELTERKAKLTCQAEVAIELNDTSKCKTLPAEIDDNYRVRGWCLMNIAEKKDDISICNEINNEERKSQCTEKLSK